MASTSAAEIPVRMIHTAKRHHTSSLIRNRVSRKRQTPETDAKRQWLPFDHLIDDGSFTDLISPVVAASITRRGF
jgi:hypothetical protein